MAGRSRANGYTLVEILVTITIMGIAGALVIPAVSSADALRSQAAVRQLISDLTFAQSDAIANQQQRAVVFDTATNSYAVHVVEAGVVLDVIYDPFSPGKAYEIDFDDADYGKVKLDAVDCGLNEPNILVFDEFGAPIDEPGGITPMGQSTIDITDPRYRFRVTIDGMTGQISTDRIPL